MNLDQMKLSAQEAFVNKRISAKFYHHWAPERCLKMLAALEAARQVNDENLHVAEVCEKEGIDLTPCQVLLKEAFEYIDNEKDGDQKSRIVTS